MPILHPTRTRHSFRHPILHLCLCCTMVDEIISAVTIMIVRPRLERFQSKNSARLTILWEGRDESIFGVSSLSDVCQSISLPALRQQQRLPVLSPKKMTAGNKPMLDPFHTRPLLVHV